MGILKKITDEYFGDVEREEDRFVSNINTMKEIDLGDFFPMVFSDIDLVVNGSEFLDYDELNDILWQIKNRGWTVPDGKEIENLFSENRHILKGSVTTYTNTIIIKNSETKKKLRLKKDGAHPIQEYWCRPQDDFKGKVRGEILIVELKNNSEIVCTKTFSNKKRKHRVRLIKYKDNM